MTIRCTNCGNADPAKFDYIEDVLIVRNVLRMHDGAAVISDHPVIAWECTDNPRLCCTSCGSFTPADDLETIGEDEAWFEEMPF